MSQKFEAQNVVAVVDELLERAVDVLASDIHFEPTMHNLTVKFRLDGVLVEIEQLPKTIAKNVISRLKILSGLLTYRNDIPQEGHLSHHTASTKTVRDMRIAIFPTIFGQRAVVRIFHEDKSLTDLEQLGLPPQVYKILKKIAGQNHGVLLFTGPAGSGKSTTLAAILRYILDHFPGRSVVTLEDPVERYIEGATQVQIPPHGDMTFPVALRSLLRQDPEVLMIGEIRDAETARIAIEAGLTGHLLMTTMHSGTPAGTLLRLLEMGIEPYQITSSICAVVNQRLLRKSCTHCGKPDDDKVSGCKRCMQTGFLGRNLIAELVVLNGDLRKTLLAGADLDALNNILQSNNHPDLFQNGMQLVRDGITTKAELRRVCPRD